MRLIGWAAVICVVHDWWSLTALFTLVAANIVLELLAHRFPNKRGRKPLVMRPGASLARPPASFAFQNVSCQRRDGQGAEASQAPLSRWQLVS